MARNSGALNKSKVEKEETYVSLQERLEKREENRNQAEDKPNALRAAMHEFPVLEESRGNDKQNILSETADRRARSTLSVSNWQGVLMGRIKMNRGGRPWGCPERHETKKKTSTTRSGGNRARIGGFDG